MIDQNTSDILQLEFNISPETINKISQENISLFPDNFNILACQSKGISSEDIIQLIQYVYGMNLYSANEMYLVVTQQKKPIKIVEEVKKKTVVTKIKNKIQILSI